MPRDARSPHARLLLLTASLAAVAWASQAVRVLVADREPSVRALVVCVATVLLGFALGRIMWVLTAASRAARQPSVAVDPTVSGGSFVFLALALIGLGATPLTAASITTVDWVLMVAGALAGGLLLGVGQGAQDSRMVFAFSRLEWTSRE